MTEVSGDRAERSSTPPQALVGTIVDEVRFVVEQGKISEFARATSAQDPVHSDRREAERRRLSDVAATATHVVVSDHYRSQATMVEKLGLELSRVVVGGTGWEYLRPLVAGDALTGRRVVIGDSGKTTSKGQALRILILESTFRDQQGSVVVRQQETIIERGR